jgi:putative ABC transport system permease protein
MRRHPVLAGLNVIGVALGVAVFLAISAANRSAVESFRAGVDLVAGRANLEVRGRIDDSLFPRIAHMEGVMAATPLVEGAVSLPGHPGEYLRILGIDPFTGQSLRTFDLLGASGAQMDIEKWLREPDAIAIQKVYADRILPNVGIPIRVLAAGRIRELRPQFVLDSEGPAGDPRLAVMDIGWAQELLASQGRLSSVQLLVAPDKLAAVRETIRHMVPADVTVDSPRLRSARVESMLGAFQLNLTALSLVSILVGAFLVYNAISAAVVRRQSQIGILRALGTSRSEIRMLFLGEAAVYGLVGSLLGLMASIPLASLLTAPVTQTIRTLYVLTSIDRLHLSAWQVASGLGVGMAASLLAAWIPANEAARSNPAQVLHPGARMDRFARVAPYGPRLAVVLLGMAAVAGWATLALRLPVLGFASSFFVIAGFSFLSPAAIRATTRICSLGSGLLGLAAANLSRALHRNSITVAALAAAIAMVTGVSVMVHSFRASVNEWVGNTLDADLYVGSTSVPRSPLPAGAEEWWAHQPGVQNVTTRADTTVAFDGRPIELAVVSGTREESLHFLGSGSAARFRDFLDPGRVAISEPLANRFGLAAGKMIELMAPQGTVRFRVAGVYQDYGSSAGIIRMKRSDYERFWPPIPVESLGITFHGAVDAEALSSRFRASFDTGGVFAVTSNRDLRHRVLSIFDQTFAVTLVLRAISIAVAIVGVLLSLLILSAERAREIGVLRSIGASRWQIANLFLQEAALLGLAASALGVLSGCCLAMVLTWVVNKAWFGWTIHLAYPAGQLLCTPLWIVPVAIVAALWPAWRAACVAPARAVRFE